MNLGAPSQLKELSRRSSAASKQSNCSRREGLRAGVPSKPPAESVSHAKGARQFKSQNPKIQISVESLEYLDDVESSF